MEDHSNVEDSNVVKEQEPNQPQPQGQVQQSRRKRRLLTNSVEAMEAEQRRGNSFEFVKAWEVDRSGGLLPPKRTTLHLKLDGKTAKNPVTPPTLSLNHCLTPLKPLLL